MVREQLGEGVSCLKSHVARPIYALSTYQCADYKLRL